MPIKTQVTVEDLYHVLENGEAEIVNEKNFTSCHRPGICLAAQPMRSLSPCAPMRRGRAQAGPMGTTRGSSTTVCASLSGSAAKRGLGRPSQ